MSGPLHGFKVIDLTSMISGPLATRTLADQGADVIKVEAPQGDHARHVATRRGGFSASFLNNNRNKRSIVLNLKNPDGLAALKRLAADADVIVQNFRPGVADRIGVGEAAIREINPQIIYVSIAGFGFDGPYANKPVFDPLIQAVSGLTTVQAGSDEERPRLVRTILPDKLTGIQAAQAITAALLSRTRTGKGQHVRLSMLDTVVSFLWSSDMGRHTFVGEENGAETAQSFIDLIYETTDGYISVAVMQNKEWQAFARAAGRPDILEDERFKTATGRETHKNERLELIQSILKDRSTAEWLEALEAEDVPCAPVLTRREVISHPQIAANDLIVELDHPEAGPIRQTRNPALFSTTEAENRLGAPVLGQQTREILAEHGFDNDTIAALEENGAAVQAKIRN
ncbi:CaiB/BaiF CoA transferase family protein [Hoeflea sp. TYP-13]|uniref:CaiB/BaiF CoA transferase family protein n=1 Tax=Hoeflea sp. TYP-13 TaxID=3230023 RepID=UPI0034C64A04